MEHIQSRYTPCCGISLDNWNDSEEFATLQQHFFEVQKLDLADRHSEPSNSTDDCIEFGGLGPVYKSVYKLKPGGYNSISALQTGSSEDGTPIYTTVSSEIALELNSYFTHLLRGGSPRSGGHLP